MELDQNTSYQSLKSYLQTSYQCDFMKKRLRVLESIDQKNQSKLKKQQTMLEKIEKAHEDKN